MNRRTTEQGDPVYPELTVLVGQELLDNARHRRTRLQGGHPLQPGEHRHFSRTQRLDDRSERAVVLAGGNHEVHPATLTVIGVGHIRKRHAGLVHLDSGQT